MGQVCSLAAGGQPGIDSLLGRQPSGAGEAFRAHECDRRISITIGVGGHCDRGRSEKLIVKVEISSMMRASNL